MHVPSNQETLCPRLLGRETVPKRLELLRDLRLDHRRRIDDPGHVTSLPYGTERT
jgi:hypothetical protein